MEKLINVIESEEEKNKRYDENLICIAEKAIVVFGKEWNKYLENKELKEYLLNLCENYEFDSLEIEQVLIGYKNGLTIDQIKIYDNLSTWYKMKWLRIALENGMDLAKLKLNCTLSSYFEPELKEIAMGYKNGLSNEQVQIYLDKKNPSESMEQIRLCLEHGLTDEQIKHCASNIYSGAVKREMRLGYENGLTREQVRYYCDRDNCEISVMTLIRKGLEKKYSKAVIELYANPCFYYNKAEALYEALEYLPYSKVKYLSETGLGIEQLRYLLNFYARSLTIEQLKFIANSAFSQDEMSQIGRGFEQGLSIEQVKVYADPEISSNYMAFARGCYKKMYNIKQVELLIKSNLSEEILEEMLKGINPNIGLRKLERYIKHKQTQERVKKQFVDNTNKKINAKKIYEVVAYLKG